MEEAYSNSPQFFDTIRFEEGVVRSSLSFYRDKDALVVLKDASNWIFVTKYFGSAGTASGGRIEFSDGDFMEYAEVLSLCESDPLSRLGFGTSSDDGIDANVPAGHRTTTSFLKETIIFAIILAVRMLSMEVRAMTRFLVTTPMSTIRG
jgi:hypothetical protein